MIRVQKPARYIGGEVNAVKKDLSEVRLRIALAFPDVYEVGMSHLGLKILYSMVNARPELYAERVYAPWPDMEDTLRSAHLALPTLETGTPLSEMDMVGFSLQYELCASTVLQMLDLGGIALRAAERKAGDPFVVGGGPVAFNPVPLSPFFDAFVIGDGEEAILELADKHLQWKDSGSSREDLLREWKKLHGVFIPALHRPGEVVSKRLLSDLARVEFPWRLPVPFCETVHDRVGLEIARGCTRGCRFCQAGMLHRPVREREPAAILELARRSLQATGWDEVALLSLSSGDYSCISELIRKITEQCAPEKVALSLPSLRTDTFDPEMAEQIRKVRKTGFTLAPEAGTDRLRRIINKGNTEEDLQKAVSTAFERGWQSLKLYFMIGLPFETDEDLDGIVDLVRKARKWARGGRITASISTFVPKAHTPFQWAGQISMEETARRRHYIRRFFQKGNVKVKFHDARVSFLEGVVARGDERISEAIENAFRKGARFDGWEEGLRFEVWMEAFKEAGIEPETYLGSRSTDEKLPWDFIDTGVGREYLLQEWENCRAEVATQDCRFGDCVGCGVCDFEEVRPRLAQGMDRAVGPSSDVEAPRAEPAVRRFRLRYGKCGRMRFLGHQDLIRLFDRAFRRGGLRLEHSKGFHPHPRLRFSPPLALGIESTVEYLDFDLTDCPLPAERVMEQLREQLPDGIEVLDVDETPLNEPTISAKIQQVTYEFTFPESVSPETLIGKVREFDLSPTFEILRTHKGKTTTRNLKDLVERVELSGSLLKLVLKSTPSGSVHPLDAAAAILGLDRDTVKTMRIRKTSVGFDIVSQ